MAAEFPRMVQLGRSTVAEVPADRFGSKAAGLAAIQSLGIPIPSGFVLTASICKEYHENAKAVPTDVPDLIRTGMTYLEETTGRTFGNEMRPLLVSVRSGAPVSMPGIMDTVLNVGLNRQTVKGLIYVTGNPRFSWNTYCRFLENYGTKVFSHKQSEFESLKKQALENEGVCE